MSDRVGRYDVFERIGEGSGGDVFRATWRTDEGVEKTAALKRIDADLAALPGFLDRFRRDAPAHLALAHSNLVQLLDAGTGDEPFLAMELVDGAPLGAILERCAKAGVLPLPVPLALHVAIETAKGLAFANGRGIAGRDLTPDDVLVSFDGEVKLTECLVWRTAWPHPDARHRASRGKAAWQAPEQVSGVEVADPRTDVFLLGALTWESLTGKKLFAKRGEVKTVQEILHGKIAPPSKSNPKIPPELDAAVLRALDRDPAKRWPDATVFGQELARLLWRSGGTTPTDVAFFLRRLFKRQIERRKRITGEKKAAPPLPPPPPGTTPSKPSPVAPPAPAAARSPADRDQLRAWIAVGAIGVTVLVVVAVRLGLHAAPSSVTIASPAASVTRASVHRSPTGAAAAAPTKVAAAGATGSLTLTFDAWGDVYVDGKKIQEGSTGVSAWPLPAGRHKLVVKQDDNTRTYDVTITAGRETVLHVDL